MTLDCTELSLVSTKTQISDTILLLWLLDVYCLNSSCSKYTQTNNNTRCSWWDWLAMLEVFPSGHSWNCRKKYFLMASQRNFHQTPSLWRTCSGTFMNFSNVNFKLTWVIYLLNLEARNGELKILSLGRASTFRHRLQFWHVAHPSCQTPV